MKKTIVLICLVIAGFTWAVGEDSAGAAEGATPGPEQRVGPGPAWAQTPAAGELAHIIQGAADLPITSVTVGDLSQIMDLASVAYQQQAHIARSARLSLMIPGLGQYVNGNTGTAIGFFAANLAIRTTQVIVGYLVLPAAVQHSNLNYLQTPMADIQARWDSLSVGELLPAVAVAASGTILTAIVRHLASRDARNLAVRSVEQGTVVFCPAGCETGR